MVRVDRVAGRKKKSAPADSGVVECRLDDKDDGFPSVSVRPVLVQPGRELSL